MGTIWLGKSEFRWQGVLWRALSQVREGTDQVLLHLVILILLNLSSDVSDSAFNTKDTEESGKSVL